MSQPHDVGEKRPVSILGPTLKFKGDLTANEDLVIQGQVEGKINHSSNLTIGKQGKVKANVKAENIAVEGTVEGDLEGRKAVIVKESANVTGNIVSPTVTLHEGSTFNGGIDMSAGAKAKAEPAAKAESPKSTAGQPENRAGKADNPGSAEAPKNQTAGAA